MREGKHNQMTARPDSNIQSPILYLYGSGTGSKLDRLRPEITAHPTSRRKEFAARQDHEDSPAVPQSLLGKALGEEILLLH
jgi:hypothetical protein